MPVQRGPGSKAPQGSTLTESTQGTVGLTGSALGGLSGGITGSSLAMKKSKEEQKLIDTIHALHEEITKARNFDEQPGGNDARVKLTAANNSAADGSGSLHGSERMSASAVQAVSLAPVVTTLNTTQLVTDLGIGCKALGGYLQAIRKTDSKKASEPEQDQSASANLRALPGHASDANNPGATAQMNAEVAAAFPNKPEGVARSHEVSAKSTGQTFGATSLSGSSALMLTTDAVGSVFREIDMLYKHAKIECDSDNEQGFTVLLGRCVSKVSASQNTEDQIKALRALYDHLTASQNAQDDGQQDQLGAADGPKPQAQQHAVHDVPTQQSRNRSVTSPLVSQALSVLSSAPCIAFLRSVCAFSLGVREASAAFDDNDLIDVPDEQQVKGQDKPGFVTANASDLRREGEVGGTTARRSHNFATMSAGLGDMQNAAEAKIEAHVGKERFEGSTANSAASSVTAGTGTVATLPLMLTQTIGQFGRETAASSEFTDRVKPKLEECWADCCNSDNDTEAKLRALRKLHDFLWSFEEPQAAPADPGQADAAQPLTPSEQLNQMSVTGPLASSGLSLIGQASIVTLRSVLATALGSRQLMEQVAKVDFIKGNNSSDRSSHASGRSSDVSAHATTINDDEKIGDEGLTAVRSKNFIAMTEALKVIAEKAGKALAQDEPGKARLDDRFDGATASGVVRTGTASSGAGTAVSLALSLLVGQVGRELSLGASRSHKIAARMLFSRDLSDPQKEFIAALDECMSKVIAVEEQFNDAREHSVTGVPATALVNATISGVPASIISQILRECHQITAAAQHLSKVTTSPEDVAQEEAQRMAAAAKAAQDAAEKAAQADAAVQVENQRHASVAQTADHAHLGRVAATNSDQQSGLATRNRAAAPLLSLATQTGTVAPLCAAIECGISAIEQTARESTAGTKAIDRELAATEALSDRLVRISELTAPSTSKPKVGEALAADEAEKQRIQQLENELQAVHAFASESHSGLARERSATAPTLTGIFKGIVSVVPTAATDTIARNWLGADLALGHKSGWHELGQLAASNSEQSGARQDALLDRASNTREDSHVATELKASAPATTGATKFVASGGTAASLVSTLALSTALKELASMVSGTGKEALYEMRGEQQQVALDENGQAAAAQQVAAEEARVRASAANTRQSTASAARLTGSGHVLNDQTSVDSLVPILRKLILGCRSVSAEPWRPNDRREDLARSARSTVSVGANLSGSATATVASFCATATMLGISADIVQLAVTKAFADLNSDNVMQGVDKFQVSGQQSNLSSASNATRVTGHGSGGTLGGTSNIMASLGEVTLSRCITAAFCQKDFLTRVLSQIEDPNATALTDSTTAATQREGLFLQSILSSEASRGELAEKLRQEVLKLNAHDDEAGKEANAHIVAAWNSASQASITAAIMTHSVAIESMLQTSHGMAKADSALPQGDQEVGLISADGTVSKLSNTALSASDAVEAYIRNCIRLADERIDAPMEAGVDDDGNQRQLNADGSGMMSTHRSTNVSEARSSFITCYTALVCSELVSSARALTLLDREALSDSATDSVRAGSQVGSAEAARDSASGQAESVSRSRSLTGLLKSLSILGASLDQMAQKLEEDIKNHDAEALVEGQAGTNHMHSGKRATMVSMLQGVRTASQNVSHLSAVVSMAPRLSAGLADRMHRSLHELRQHGSLDIVATDKSEQSARNSAKGSRESETMISTGQGVDTTGNVISNLLRSLCLTGLWGAEVPVTFSHILEISLLARRPELMFTQEARMSSGPAGVTGELKQSASMTGVGATLGSGATVNSTGGILTSNSTQRTTQNTDAWLQTMMNSLLARNPVLDDPEEAWSCDETQEQSEKHINDKLGKKEFYALLLDVLSRYFARREGPSAGPAVYRLHEDNDVDGARKELVKRYSMGGLGLSKAYAQQAPGTREYTAPWETENDRGKWAREHGLGEANHVLAAAAFCACSQAIDLSYKQVAADDPNKMADAAEDPDAMAKILDVAREQGLTKAAQAELKRFIGEYVRLLDLHGIAATGSAGRDNKEGRRIAFITDRAASAEDIIEEIDSPEGFQQQPSATAEAAAASPSAVPASQPSKK